MREPLIVGVNAGADLSANDGFVVKRSGANCVLATDGTISGGEVILGVVTQGGGNTSGGRCSINFDGPGYGKAGGVLTRGVDQFLTCNASGKLVAASAGDQVVAEWIDDGSDAAVADGDWIPIRVCKHRYVTGLATTNVIRADLSAAAEAADAIVVTVNLVDGSGNAINASRTLMCSLYMATGIEALAAAYTLAETGAGAEVSTTANARLIITTDASGDASLTVTDVAGASNATIYLVVQPIATGINQVPVPSYLPLTFDNA